MWMDILSPISPGNAPENAKKQKLTENQKTTKTDI